jgi:O-acetyl-ADP-ribose deacetylase
LSHQQAKSFLNGIVTAKLGDITREAVDAIVNAANSSLLGGGGVDGAIHRAGGPEILEACKEIRRTQYPQGLPTGEAVLTPAGRLIARYVIHTVGPVYGHHGGAEPALLAGCYSNSLQIARNEGLSSVAFPAISTGVFRFPRAEAAAVASSTIEQFLSNETGISEVRLIFFQQSDLQSFLDNHGFSG